MKKENKRLLLGLAAMLCCAVLCLVLLTAVFPKGPLAVAAAPTATDSRISVRDAT